MIWQRAILLYTAIEVSDSSKKCDILSQGLPESPDRR